MKKINYIKKALILATFASTILLFVSCSNNPKDSKTVAEDHNKEKFDDRKQKKDAQFLVDAAEINLEQIQLGKLAQQKGAAAHVKELGKVVEDAHTKSQRELTTLANNKRVSIPSNASDDAKDEYKKLNEKSREDFDKAFADLMVSKHKDAVKTFENASTDLNDADIKNWARSTLPHLRSHLDRSKECQEKFADMHLEEKR